MITESDPDNPVFTRGDTPSLSVAESASIAVVPDGAGSIDILTSSEGTREGAPDIVGKAPARFLPPASALALAPVSDSHRPQLWAAAATLFVVVAVGVVVWWNQMTPPQVQKERVREDLRPRAKVTEMVDDASETARPAMAQSNASDPVASMEAGPTLAATAALVEPEEEEVETAAEVTAKPARTGNANKIMVKLVAGPLVKWTVNGKSIGRGSLQTKVPRRTKSLTAKDQGGLIRVPLVGQVADFNQVPTGLVSIRVVPWAHVTLGGKALGSTPLRPVSLKAGTYRFVLDATLNGESRRVVREVKVIPGKTVPLHVRIDQ